MYKQTEKKPKEELEECAICGEERPIIITALRIDLQTKTHHTILGLDMFHHNACPQCLSQELARIQSELKRLT